MHCQFLRKIQGKEWQKLAIVYRGSGGSALRMLSIVRALGVYADGSSGYHTSDYGTGGVRPAFVISSSILVKEKKNGGYKFDWKEAY